ncbi:hypothetical protein K3757_11170 [Sulfitobacter sp. S223]|uniref:hypothetical protein n=1 Tax=Sulfitobacter sp. S223 TaxID=2867023 RepID=UPI0021A368C1|nr:hypothetical protein [Sulfitobacter sp. S223]UWR25037.1 hypothetical protein K3757_11170 [Sulfitobacter sp. S223]
MRYLIAFQQRLTPVRGNLIDAYQLTDTVPDCPLSVEAGCIEICHSPRFKSKADVDQAEPLNAGGGPENRKGRAFDLKRGPIVYSDKLPDDFVQRF